MRVHGQLSEKQLLTGKVEKYAKALVAVYRAL
jgi:hypothetical protein